MSVPGIKPGVVECGSNSVSKVHILLTASILHFRSAQFLDAKILKNIYAIRFQTSSSMCARMWFEGTQNSATLIITSAKFYHHILLWRLTPHPNCCTLLSSTHDSKCPEYWIAKCKRLAAKLCDYENHLDHTWNSPKWTGRGVLFALRPP